MQEYTDKQALIDEIIKRYDLYDKEFDEIKDSEKDIKKLAVDKTPSNNLSYQLGWLGLLLQWEKDEKNGLEVKTPTPEYKWNNLGGLYQSFYQQYCNHSLSQQRLLLKQRVTELIKWLESITEDELFLPGQRKWATTTAKWPVWKWVHINSVAPFKNFRSQIRKWKKN